MNKHVGKKSIKLIVVFYFVGIKQHLKLKIRIVKRVQRNKHCNYDYNNCDRLRHSFLLNTKGKNFIYVPHMPENEHIRINLQFN